MSPEQVQRYVDIAIRNGLVALGLEFPLLNDSGVPVGTFKLTVHPGPMTDAPRAGDPTISVEPGGWKSTLDPAAGRWGLDLPTSDPDEAP